MENEKRLIDASAWKSFYEDKKNILDRFYTHDAGYEDALDNVDDWMDAQPTVDAVEVIHAYWTGSRFNPMTDEYEEYCSHCCAWSSEYGKPYCPNCGAKMDGDGDA